MNLASRSPPVPVIILTGNSGYAAYGASTRMSLATPDARAVGPTAPRRSDSSAVILPTPRMRPISVSSVVTILR